MPNAQEWLDREYPMDKRAGITKLDIVRKDLTGSLEIKDFPNLNRLDCSNNQLTNLGVTNCGSLTSLSCSNNQLTNLDFLNNLTNPQKLTSLEVSNNNFPSQDLSIFSRFINLTNLMFGNDNRDLIRQGIYNRWTGSLEPLKNLTKLRRLCIESTDIDSGLEYLSDSLNEAQYDSDSSFSNVRVFCSPKKRPGSKVAKIKEQLKPYNYNLGKWKQANKHLAQQEGKINSLQDEINTLKTQKKDLENKLNSEITTLRTNLTNKKQDLTNSLKNLDKLKKDLTEKETQHNCFQETILNLQVQLKAKEEELSKVLRESNNTTSSLRAEIKQLKENLTKSQGENTKLVELEKNLLTLTVSSSLLLKQLEDLTIDLTDAEQEQERLKLENATKGKDYQDLFRTSESNLTQIQEIITAKNENLANLEEEKNDLTAQLTQAQAIITDLENNIITSLETKIKDLENYLIDDDDKQAEITNLKQQLTSEKSRFNQQLTKLQSELTSASKKEQALSAKIAELSKKKTKLQENDVTNNSSSLWDKISTPLLYGGGIGIIVVAFVWVRNKFKKD